MKKQRAARDWRAYMATPGGKATARRYQLKRHYGMTEAEFEQLAREQDHKCAICFQARKLHVDHDHRTGKIRGLLCGQCNKCLGLMEDTPARLLEAARYLAKGR